MDYEKLKTYRNKTNAFANLIGMEVTEIRSGYASAQMPIHPNLLNPINSVHGGCLFTIADVVGGAAACSYGYNVTTLDSSFHYLRAGLNTRMLFAETKELKKGKRALVYDVSVYDQDRVLLAEGIFTYMSLGTEIKL